jgi:LysW-gamma-L-lysine/LysW-L-ornithine aminotransferase
MTLSASRTEQLLALEHKYDSGVYNKHGIVLVRGKGARVWDEDGIEYVDCVGGYGVANIGHSNPSVVKAIQDQAGTLMMLPQTLPNDKRALFLEELNSVTPAHLDRFFLCNSGTEAVEAAIKFARTATGREKFVAMKRGFSGRSLGALALTFEPKYREPFGNLVHETSFVTYNDIASLEAAIDGETAAVMLEAVQGEGGVRPIDPAFLRRARELCTQHGAMLIVDEIQAGFCRTGKWWGFEHACEPACTAFPKTSSQGCELASGCAVKPDMITLAKAMAGGVPIGALAMTSAVADKMPKGGHGTTFGGNPLAMAAGIAAIRFMKAERLDERAREMGEYLMAGLRGIASRKIKEVRGKGLLVGLELKEKSAPYIHALEHDHHILTLLASPTVIRYLPPLVIEQSDLDRVIEKTAVVLETLNLKGD